MSLDVSALGGSPLDREGSLFFGLLFLLVGRDGEFLLVRLVLVCSGDVEIAEFADKLHTDAGRGVVGVFAFRDVCPAAERAIGRGVGVVDTVDLH